MLDQKVRAELLALKEYAQASPLSMDDMLDTMNGDRHPVGDDVRHVWQSQFGFRLVLSLEQHTDYDLFHISVSVPDRDKLPNIQAVSMMLAALSFPTDPNDWVKTTLEKNSAYQAVHIWVK